MHGSRVVRQMRGQTAAEVSKDTLRGSNRAGVEAPRSSAIPAQGREREQTAGRFGRILCASLEEAEAFVVLDGSWAHVN